MTGPGADIQAVVLARVAPLWVGSFGSPDEVSRDDARELMLEALAETERLKDELDEYADRLAKMAALAGASHEQRGAAVGVGKEAARRRWPYETTKGAAPIQPAANGLEQDGAESR